MQKEKNKKDLKDLLLKIFNTLYLYHSTLGSRGNLSTKYRVSSYAKIISILNKLEKPVYSSNDLKDIPNIGKSTLEKVDIIEKNGTYPLYEEIIKDKEFKILIELQKVRGLGPEKAYKIYKDGYKDVKSLRKDVLNGNYKVDNNLIYSLKYFNDLNKKIKRNEITDFTNYLKKEFNVNFVNTGSYRMGKSYSGDIDLLCIIKNNSIINLLKKSDLFKHIYNVSNKKINGIIENPLTHKIHQIDILFIKKRDLPWYLLYFGSGKEFSKKIRFHAIQKGYKLSEKGLYDAKSGKKINFRPKNEKDIFIFLDFPYIIPEKR